ncbi:MAG TPA: hypothetical protein VFJ05_06965 [Nitrososphaeraceae archaeon]|nr:hypothetical protein [Nitrososphaeraceae archaeon]
MSNVDMQLNARDLRTIRNALVVYKTYQSDESPHLYSSLMTLIEKVNNLLLNESDDERGWTE